MDVHVYVHFAKDEEDIEHTEIIERLEEILETQEISNRKLNRIMAKVDDLLAELEQANQVTNEVASDLDDLVARLSGGLSETEASQVQSQLAALKDRLTQVAAVHTPGSSGTEGEGGVSGSTSPSSRRG